MSQLRNTTALLVGVMSKEERHDIINHIVDSWERSQLTEAATSDLEAIYELDLHGFGEFIENSIGDDDAVTNVLKEIGMFNS